MAPPRVLGCFRPRCAGASASCIASISRGRDIHEIVRRSALGVEVDDVAGREIARRSRGTPRIANRLLRRVRDYAQVRADGSVTVEVAHAALQLLEVDDRGFDSSIAGCCARSSKNWQRSGEPQQPGRSDP